MEVVKKSITCPNCGEAIPDPIQIDNMEMVIKAARHEALNHAIHRYKPGDERRIEAFQSRMLSEIVRMASDIAHLDRAPVNLVEFHASRFIPERDLKKAIG